MWTAIDSSVLWSIFRGEAGARALVDLLVAIRRDSVLILCDIVFAEIAPFFRDLDDLGSKLESLGVEYGCDRSSECVRCG